jgi:PAS domain S-box-containing protein
MDVSSMNDYAVVMADRSGTIQFWSRGAEAMLGFAAADAVGKRLDMIVPPDYREQHWAGFNKAMAAGSAAMEGQAFDLPALDANGATLLCPATFVLVRDGQRRTIGAMAILAAPAAT